MINNSFKNFCKDKMIFFFRTPFLGGIAVKKTAVLLLKVF